MNARIGLLWHSLESGNLGVRALTLAQLALLDGIAAGANVNLQVVLFTNPVSAPLQPSSYLSERVRIVDTVPMSARDLSVGASHLLSAFRRCDLLIDIAEGDSFTDVYGRRRYVKQVASKLLALAARCPLVLAPQTIGPFDGRATRAFPAHILRRSEAVFVRDEASARYARSLGGEDRISGSADLAFLLPFPPPRQAASDKVKIGLNVSGLLYNQRPADGRFRLSTSYSRLIDRLIGEFAGRRDCELHLVAHVAGAGGTDEDADTCARLSEARNLTLAPAFDDPREAKSYIAGMDFFIGARMHACIAAFSAGVPLLPLAYTRKATGLFRSLDYPVVGDMMSADEGSLARLAFEWFERRHELLPALERGNALAAERLRPYERRLGELIRGLAR